MRKVEPFMVTTNLSPSNLKAINACLDRYVETGFVRDLTEAALVSVMDDFALSLGDNKVAMAELRMLVHGTIQAIRTNNKGG